MKTVIMAGGRGTRISEVAKDLPKPMIRIAGKPVLEHELECLRDQGFTDLIITVSFMGQVIMDYFGDGSGTSPATGKPFGVNITYFEEREPLGNAGALFFLREQGLLMEDFLLLNADALFDVDFNRFVNFHESHDSLVTLLTHPNDHPYDSGLIITDKDGYVTQWLAKEDTRPRYHKNRVNAGLHILSPKVLDEVKVHAGRSDIRGEDGRRSKVDLDRQVLKPLAGTKKMLCYDSPEYVKDMGTPERFERVSRDFETGKIHAKNLRNPQKAIFLDRDGTINRYKGFLTDIDEFELLPEAAEAIRMLNETGWLVIVVTNQPVIARGEVTEDQLLEIHNKMETLLGQEGAYLDAVYYCPHHPDKGFEGEIRELKITCTCRKPKPGMLLSAAEDFNIDLTVSWMIGDSETDIRAGKAAGCKTVLLGNGDYGQDLLAGSIKEAAEKIADMFS